MLSPCCVVISVAIISKLDQPGEYCGVLQRGSGLRRRICAQLWEESGDLRGHRGWTCGREHPNRGRVGGCTEAGIVLCESITATIFSLCGSPIQVDVEFFYRGLWFQNPLKKRLGFYLEVSPSHIYSVSHGWAVDVYTCLNHTNRKIIFFL